MARFRHLRDRPVWRSAAGLWFGVWLALGGGGAWADGVNLAQATFGYTYYNRPGATVEQHRRDVVDCAHAASGLASLGSISGSQVVRSLSLVAGDASLDRSLARAGLENCMVVRGWRVVMLPDEEGAALAQLASADIGARLAPWIGAEQPHGAVVRLWSNAAAHGASEKPFIFPGKGRDEQLSLLAAAPELRKLPPPPMRTPASPWVNPRWPRALLSPADLAAVRPDAAVLLVQIRMTGLQAWSGVIFNREGADKDSTPSLTDHAPDLAVITQVWLDSRRDMFAVAVPPGRWRLFGLVNGQVLNLCLGSPSFELKAGEVVYAGAFDTTGKDLGPDMDLAAAKAWLADSPKVVRAAEYINGSLGPCGAATIYALEFEGKTFEPGYTWGSRAAPQMAPP